MRICRQLWCSAPTGADGKQYEMCCLPVEFIFGWIFTVNPKNVKPEAQEAVRQYRMQCYRVLYRHFTGHMQRVVEQNQVEIALLEQLADYNQQKEVITKGINDTKRKLEKLRSERLKDEPTPILKTKNGPKCLLIPRYHYICNVYHKYHINECRTRACIGGAGIFMSVLKENLYRYLCTPVWNCNGTTAFVEYVIDSGKGTGTFLY